eukprot:CAMPEP_0185031554 /NCGR_PEP_ID=MMETSP1103-20130426/19093_1 /TAXON_ID=36769 /ORGANISM="Paraphysomonas bandaiensis, Strain Caron Lab Isolate" /LENGTH=71 /DNA_ID=CAMNT_0027567109 /DNA_START=123 /DNA_END=334 /DNA_ORIENTATION=-
MPWKMLSYDETTVSSALSRALWVMGIPTLVLLDEKGNVLTRDGRTAIMTSPFSELHLYDKKRRISRGTAAV